MNNVLDNSHTIVLRYLVNFLTDASFSLLCAGYIWCHVQ